MRCAGWRAICEDAVALADSSDEGRTEMFDLLNGMRGMLERNMTAWMQKTSDDNQNVLEFWKTQKDGLTSAFVAIACVYLAIPATTAPSERSFSSTTGVVTKKRNRIGDQLLENLTVSRDWIASKCFSFEEILNELAKFITENEKQEVERLFEFEKNEDD